MNLKQSACRKCREIVAGKLTALKDAMQDLAASAANETKSTAGDKYETARAMLHIEQDRVRKQIAVLSAQQTVLDAIDPDVPLQRVALGSFVETARATYFLSIALGKLHVEGQDLVALSLQSPLGAALKGLQAGDKFVMNDGIEAVIKAVY